MSLSEHDPLSARGLPSQERSPETIDGLSAGAASALPALIVVTDAQGRIRWATQSFQRVTGHAWSDLAGRDLARVLGTPEARRLRAAFADGRGEVRSLSVQVGSGEPRIFDLTIEPLSESVGAEPGRAVACIDATSRAALSARLAHVEQLADIGAVAAGVAHEIATPVQFVGDSVQFLRDACRDLAPVLHALRAVRDAAAESRPAADLAAAAIAAEADADLEYLLENVPKAIESCADGLERVNAIVRALKESAHPQQLEMQRVDLSEVIDRTLILARNEYKYVADVATTFASLPPVMCQAASVSQVVLNLVVNAAHAIGDVVSGTSDRGTITLATRIEGRSAVLAISDTGGGIPEHVRSRMFEPFFTTKPVGKGTGQGLSIAHRIVVETHGGQIAVASEVGRGTTFEIRLPIDGPARVNAGEAA